MRTNFLIAKYFVFLLAAYAGFSQAASEDEINQFKNSYSQYQESFTKGAYADSLPLAQQAMEAGKVVYGEESKSYAALHHNYGINLLRLARYPEALDSFEDTLEIYQRVYEKDAPELIDVYLNLADAERNADYLSEWTRHNRDALGLARKTMGKDSAEYAFLLLEVGHTEFVNQGSDGEQKIEDGFSILQDITPEPAQMGYANFLKGKVEMAHRRYDQALPYLTTSVQKIKAGPAAIDSRLLLTALGFITVALEETGQSSLATENLAEIGLIKEKLGDNSVEPVFKVQPRIPNDIETRTTGTLLNVKQINEGSVTIEFDVDEKGFTTNHSVFLSVGPQSYVEAGLEAVRKYRYAPRFVNGQPVGMTGMQQTFNFLIDN